MDTIKLYEIDNGYIDYLSAFSPHLFTNRKSGQTKERKYIGIVFEINGYDYFAPLSSFKEKHRMMKDGVDFLKVKDYAVINLNNMFPAPKCTRKYVNISAEKDLHYRALLLAEYRYIKSIQEKIRKNVQAVYKIKLRDGETTALAKRCNDFRALEKASEEYSK